MTNKYKYGRSKEKLIAKDLTSKGSKVTLNPGSRGAADLTAKFQNKTWKVQVKSSRVGTPKSPNSIDLGRLKGLATKSKATPVIAKVKKNKITYFSARNNRKLKP